MTFQDDEKGSGGLRSLKKHPVNKMLVIHVLGDWPHPEKCVAEQDAERMVKTRDILYTI